MEPKVPRRDPKRRSPSQGFRVIRENRCSKRYQKNRRNPWKIHENSTHILNNSLSYELMINDGVWFFTVFSLIFFLQQQCCLLDQGQEIKDEGPAYVLLALFWIRTFAASIMFFTWKSHGKARNINENPSVFTRNASNSTELNRDSHHVHVFPGFPGGIKWFALSESCS